MRAFLKKYSNFICVFLSAIMLLLYLSAYHDMQTAEGVGLYFALKRENADRLPFDLAADALRMGATLLLLILPCLLTKHRGSASFLRLLSAWTALMPVLSMASLIPLLDGLKSSLWGVTLQESGLIESFWRGELEITRLLLTWVPLVCILMIGISLTGQKVTAGWYRLPGVVILVLIAGIFVFPGLFMVWQFVSLYLILVCSFDLWERLLDAHPQMNQWSWILFGLMWLRGIYRLLELMSVSHL